MTSLKSKLLNIYYTAQAGYNATSWLVALLAYTSIAVLAVHFILPNLSAETISIGAPLAGLIFFYIFGHFFIKKGGYAASQTFAGDANPTRLMWVLELKKANVSIEQCYLLMKIAKQNNLDTTTLEKSLEDIKGIKATMEKLLS